jgi:hypothetical protein
MQCTRMPWDTGKRFWHSRCHCIFILLMGSLIPNEIFSCA